MAHGEIEEKKSRFIAHIFSVENEDEAEQYINAGEEKVLGCKT